VKRVAFGASTVPSLGSEDIIEESPAIRNEPRTGILDQPTKNLQSVMITQSPKNPKNVLLLCVVFSSERTRRYKRDMRRIIATETICDCKVYTMDRLSPPMMNPERHISVDLNHISQETIDGVLLLTGGSRFQEVTLDFCWCQSAYYSTRISPSFFSKSLSFIRQLLTGDGSIFLPCIPSFVARTYENRANLRLDFEPVEFLDLNDVREMVQLVKGHESIPDTEWLELEKKPDQLGDIATTLLSVQGQLSPTGPSSDGKGLKEYIESILRDRKLSEMKMIQLRPQGQKKQCL
jgi:hypothetical protein